MNDDLTRKDFAILSRSVKGFLRDEDMVVSEENEAALKRLAAADMIEANTNKLTKLGIDTASSSAAARFKLRNGVPFKQRKNLRIDQPDDSGDWFSGLRKKKPVLFNRSSAFATKPPKGLQSLAIDKLTRPMFEEMLKVALLTDEVGVVVNPVAIQANELDDMECVWLASEDGEVRVAIQACFFNLIATKFQKAAIHYVGIDKPLQIRSKKIGTGFDGKGTVGLVMPLKVKAIPAVFDKHSVLIGRRPGGEENV